MEKLRAEEKLQHAEELLAAYLATIREKTNLIENLDAELERLKETNSNNDNLRTLADNMEKLFSATILTDDDWRHFRGLFEQVHPGFLFRRRRIQTTFSKAHAWCFSIFQTIIATNELDRMLKQVAPNSNRYSL